MLAHLSIRNIVLIETLDLECGKGLSVLTGETGAGKSILLDSLGLALGMRADIGLIRRGTEKASVTASFSFIDKKHYVFDILKEYDISIEDTQSDIILRRSLTIDGRSKSFINDQPVSLSLLKTIGGHLVEIHGQFETQGLLQTKYHRHILDNYGEYDDALNMVSVAWHDWQKSLLELEDMQHNLKKNQEDEDYLKHLVGELKQLAPEVGEEASLMQKRSILGNQEKLSASIELCHGLLSGESGAETLLVQAQNSLSRISENIELVELDNAIMALDRANIELADAMTEIDALSNNNHDSEYMSLDMIEERLFALRDVARKHNCSIDELNIKFEEISHQLELINNQDETLSHLINQEQKNREIYQGHATNLTKQRYKTAHKLEQLLQDELPNLKLENVVFITKITTTDKPNDWAEHGMDQVNFLVATNSGQTPAPLGKVASGGELSRLMLAFKVVMAGKNRIPVLIFDEIDSGIGGAVSDAVGEHLKKLSSNHQVLVVTHSPQVAAKANNHWVISKDTKDDSTYTNIEKLATDNLRMEEIARMLSGQDITIEARAAATKLIETTKDNRAA